MEPEHLIRLKLEDGTAIDFHRTEDKEIQVWHGDHCVKLPRATGQQTLDLLALLEPFGKIEETKDETP